MRQHLSVVAVLLFICVAMPARLYALSPIANDERTVQPLVDATKTVTVIGGMVWYDSNPAEHGIRFPPGVYALEGEDADYLYFHSSRPLEFRVFSDGKIVNAKNIPGGLMLSKHWLSLIPAAGYIDDSSNKKLMLWKLGRGFLEQKGKSWTRNF